MTSHCLKLTKINGSRIKRVLRLTGHLTLGLVIPSWDPCSVTIVQISILPCACEGRGGDRKHIPFPKRKSAGKVQD